MLGQCTTIIKMFCNTKNLTFLCINLMFCPNNTRQLNLNLTRIFYFKSHQLTDTVTSARPFFLRGKFFSTFHFSLIKLNDFTESKRLLPFQPPKQNIFLPLIAAAREKTSMVFCWTIALRRQILQRCLSNSYFFIYALNPNT